MSWSTKTFCLTVTLYLCVVNCVTSFQFRDDDANFENRLDLLSALNEDSPKGINQLNPNQESKLAESVEYESGDETSDKESSKDETSDEEPWFKYLNMEYLTNSWWKICIWILCFLLLFCICAFVTRCCYLVWDCCTDSYWGCCPRRECCKKFCLLKWCPDSEKTSEAKHKQKRRRNKSYEVVSEEEDHDVVITQQPVNPKQKPEVAQPDIDDDVELQQEDFTLRTLESSNEVQAPVNNNNNNSIPGSLRRKDQTNVSEIQLDVISNFSTLEKTNETSARKSDQQRHFFTSTPLRPSAPSKKLDIENVPAISTLEEVSKENSTKIRVNSVFTEADLFDEESLPQIHEGHYFNVLNIFKIGGARYEYRVARKHSEISNASPDHSFERRRPNDSKFTMYSGHGDRAASYETSIETATPLLTPTTPTSGWRQHQLSSDDEDRQQQQQQQQQRSRKISSNGSNNRKKRSSSKNKKSTNKSFDGNVDTFLAANQSDFLLSDSFSNMSTTQQQQQQQPSPLRSSSVNKSQRSYGLFIEEGQTGKYNPLPEAQSELWPPEQLARMKSSAFQSGAISTNGGPVKGLERRSRSMDVYTKMGSRSSSQPQTATRRGKAMGEAGAQSQNEVFCHSRAQSAERKISTKAFIENVESRHLTNGVNHVLSKSETSTRTRDNHVTRRPPPVPLRLSKKTTSMENTMPPQTPSQPPTPPPPLAIEDLSPRKHPQSLEDIFNYEKNILYGRETTL